MKKEREFTRNGPQWPLTIQKEKQQARKSLLMSVHKTMDKVLLLHLNQIKLPDLTKTEEHVK